MEKLISPTLNMKVERAPMIEMPAAVIMQWLADEVRAADTDEKRERLARRLREMAKAYTPFLVHNPTE
jgi:nicotinamide riboside kinase